MDPDRNSRYAKTPVVVVTDRTGRPTELRDLRDIPKVAAVFAATPTDADRLDLLAFRYYRDPLLFWKVCDASDQMDPFDVVAPGEPLPVPPNK